MDRIFLIAGLKISSAHRIILSIHRIVESLELKAIENVNAYIAKIEEDWRKWQLIMLYIFSTVKMMWIFWKYQTLSRNCSYVVMSMSQSSKRHGRCNNFCSALRPLGWLSLAGCWTWQIIETRALWLANSGLNLVVWWCAVIARSCNHLQQSYRYRYRGSFSGWSVWV